MASSNIYTFVIGMVTEVKNVKNSFSCHSLYVNITQSSKINFSSFLSLCKYINIVRSY